MVDFSKISNAQTAAWLKASMEALTLPSFASSTADNHWAVGSKRRAAQRLLDTRVVKGYKYADSPTRDDVDVMLDWLSQYKGTGAFYECSDDGSMTIGWLLERPATEEELDTAQRYLVENPEQPQPNVGPALRFRSPTPFTGAF